MPIHIVNNVKAKSNKELGDSEESLVRSKDLKELSNEMDDTDEDVGSEGSSSDSEISDSQEKVSYYFYTNF